MRHFVFLLTLVVMALCFASIPATAQSAGSVPFVTTPYIPRVGQTLPLLARLSDGTYTELVVSTSHPHTLLSGMAGLASLIAAGGKTLEAMPAAPPHVGTASQPGVLADFTGDGSLDIAFYNLFAQPSDVYVFYLTPAFGAKTFATVDVGPNIGGGMVTGDFNGDGKVDLAVGYSGASANGGVAILLNNGDGTFAPIVTIPVIGYVNSIATYDVNGDGKLDIAVGEQNAMGAGSVVMLLGNGDGTFRQSGSNSVPGADAVTIADFNGDGLPDLAVTGYMGSLSILIGKGDGTFTAGASYATGKDPQYLAAGDLNGDGKLDLAVSNTGDNTLSVFLGNGDGTFTAGASYSMTSLPEWLVLTDYNADGKLDILSGIGDQRGLGPANKAIDILIGNGDGTFEAAPSYVPPAPTSGAAGVSTFVVSADFNGDGKTDAITNNQFGNSLFLFAGHGDGTFAQPVALTTKSGLVSALTADFNGDGKPDLAAVGNFDNTVNLYLNTGGSFGTPVTFSSGGTMPAWLTAADFNGDGKLDLAVANAGSAASGGAAGNVVVFAGTGGTNFTTSATLSAGSTPAFVSAADLNGDGKPDLVVANLGSPGTSKYGSLYVFLNDGHGGFGAGTALTVSNFPTSVTVADVNGDGKADLVVTTSDTNTNFYIGVALGNGDGTFQNPALIPTEFGVAYIAARDFNGDGKVDLAVSHCCGDTNMTFLAGNGDGTFQPEIDFNGGLSPNALAVADVNGDGKPDLLIGGHDNSGLTVLLDEVSTTGVATVNAASFATNRVVAPDSIAAVFGTDLATQTVGASGSLTDSLGGTSVTVTDSSGMAQLAPLFYVSPGQVNIQVPPGTATGTAAIAVKSGDGTVSTGTVTIAAIAPGLFQADNLALGNVIQIVNGNQVYSSTVAPDPNHPGGVIPVPIAISASGTYLVLYGTGIRGAALSQVSLQIGSAMLPVSFAGSTGAFAGEDQVNVQLPTSLAGSGDVAIVLMAEGMQSNTVHVTIQ